LSESLLLGVGGERSMKLKVTGKLLLAAAKFVIGIIIVLCVYKILLVHQTTVMNENDNTMKPTLNPRDRIWYTKTDCTASQMKKNDIILYRCPEGPLRWRAARVMGLPGQTIKGNFIPRGHVWVARDCREYRDDPLDIGLVHENFIIGKAHWLKILPRDEG
jgi:signal peptidase I